MRLRDAAVLQAWPQLTHFGAEIDSFGDTAALATLLDAVVSVDTSVAHLAGALARPLSVLLPYSPDWRWLLERDDSPWYPTARLFRRAVGEPREAQVQRVREALRQGLAAMRG